MPSVRIATFNVENLFARFNFNADVDPVAAVRDGWNANEQLFTIQDDDSKRITGQTISELRADVLALQEVEGLDTLRRFRTEYLGGYRAYPYMVVVDGNDPRLIDLAVLSKHPIVHVRSHQHLRAGAGRAAHYVFSRDCLEVDVSVEGKPLTLFVNHLKSMLDKRAPAQGRANTRAKRIEQAQAVRQIVVDRFGRRPGGKPFVVLGDLNDYRAVDAQGEPAILDLLDWNQVENVVERLPAEEQWTHFFKGSGRRLPPGYHQLDYVLTSRSLAAGASAPTIFRKGQPKRAVRYPGPHFDRIGHDSPKASDHCPVAVDVAL